MAAAKMVLIYIFMGVSVYFPLCAVGLCVIANQITSKKPLHLCQITVSLMLCCVKHTGGGWWGWGLDKIWKRDGRQYMGGSS